MGYQRSFQVSSQEQDRPWTIHPIWRGFGCVMLVVIPIISYAAASLLIDLNIEQNWGVPVPVGFGRTVPIDIPAVVPEVAGFHWEIPHLYGNLLLGVVLMILGFGILMFFYAILYSIMGPSRQRTAGCEPRT